MSKRAVFFTLDAFIGALIILFALGAYVLLYGESTPLQSIDHVSEDVLSSMAELKMSELSLPAALQNTTDSENTVLEQVAEFWATGHEDLAEQLFSLATANLSGQQLAIYINDQPVAFDSTGADELITHKRLLSGIDINATIKGYTARTYLTRVDLLRTSEYLYFGGYIGEGNITYRMALPQNVTITGASIEGVFGTGFTLQVNGANLGSYAKSNGTSSAKYTLPHDHFSPGDNTVKLLFSGNDSYIGGGFLKVDIAYGNVAYTPQQVTHSMQYFFPGADPIINIFDSFTVPGTLTNISAYLHFLSNYNFTFSLANATVFANNNMSNTTQQVTLNEAMLAQLLDFTLLSNGTVPLRIGIKNITRTIARGTADVILITDVSGSMEQMLRNSSTGVNRNCTDPSLYNDTTQRIAVARCIDKYFVDQVLNNSGNRVGLVSFSTSAGTYTSLSENATYLKSRIDLYTPGGGTCVCCAINRAYNILNSESNSSRDRYIITMTDGITGYRCTSSGSCGSSYQGTSTTGSSCCSGLESDCNNNACNGAVLNANYSSWRAHQNLNATVYAVGFTNLSGCFNANRTLTYIAESGGGSVYISANATELARIYQVIADEILVLSYIAQQTNVTGNLSRAILYEDSYINITYVSSLQNMSYGFFPVRLQTPAAGNNVTNLSLRLPPGAQLLDAGVTSYSGPSWTKLVAVNGIGIFNISRFGIDYSKIGDPFYVSLPVSQLQQNNTIVVTVGGSTNDSGGSPDDRIIYSMAIKGVGAYSEVYPNATGCTWHLVFEDATATDIRIPSDYEGDKKCYYANASFDKDDAIDQASYLLLSQLDLLGSNKIYVNIDQASVNLSTVSSSRIPGLWGPLTVEVRAWR